MFLCNFDIFLIAVRLTNEEPIIHFQVFFIYKKNVINFEKNVIIILVF